MTGDAGCRRRGRRSRAALASLRRPPRAGEGRARRRGAAAAQPPASGAGGGYAQRFAAECAACHGANGKSEMPGTPDLAGQHSYYAITQLFLFREGRRSNEAMTAMAKTMKDDDLRGFSDFIATLPPVPRAATRRRRPTRRG